MALKPFKHERVFWGQEAEAPSKTQDIVAMNWKIHNSDYAKDMSMFKLPYFFGDLEPVETPIGSFQAITANHYHQVPYTLWEIYNLFEKGAYLESGIVYRHILDVFIQMRYFHKYPEKYEGHLAASHLIPLKRMYDEFSGGYYQPYYGKILSGMAHGGISSGLFRTRYETSTKGEITYGREFEEWRGLVVMNQVPPIAFGYINYFPVFFPKNTLHGNEGVSEMISWAKGWLEEFMRQHKEKNPKSHEWYKHIDLFIH